MSVACLISADKLIIFDLRLNWITWSRLTGGLSRKKVMLRSPISLHSTSIKQSLMGKWRPSNGALIAVPPQPGGNGKV